MCERFAKVSPTDGAKADRPRKVNTQLQFFTAHAHVPIRPFPASILLEQALDRATDQRQLARSHE